jgi:heme oxygenase (mycobilin-producing)
MITVANRISVDPAYGEAFEERFRTRAEMPGFISNQVLCPVNPGEPYVVLTFWATRARFEAWVRSDAFREGGAGIAGPRHPVVLAAAR